MNTLIEILDYELTENIISPLVFRFNHLIYLYDEHHDDAMKRQNLYDFLMKKGNHDIQFIKASGQLDLFFKDLSEKYPDAIYHLSNGTRTLLVQMAQFCERSKQRCYTMNFQKKVFTDLMGCSDLKQQFYIPKMSIEELISLRDGEILKTSHALPVLDEKMTKELMTSIEMMNSDSVAWSKLLSSFAKSMKDNEGLPELWIDTPTDHAQKTLLDRMDEHHIVHVHQHNQKMRIDFVNPSLMKLFADSGAWLEYQSYLECVRSQRFDDVRISTVIDWDKHSENPNDPTCEIDLIVIKDCISAFVSCKLNKCTALDIYEIKLLSEKLGGSLAKAAVITKTSSLQKGTPLSLKAEHLDVKIVDQKMIEDGKIAEELEKFLKS